MWKFIMFFLLLVIYYHVTQTEVKAGGSSCQTTELGTETLHRAEFAV